MSNGPDASTNASNAESGGGRLDADAATIARRERMRARLQERARRSAEIARSLNGGPYIITAETIQQHLDDLAAIAGPIVAHVDPVPAEPVPVPEAVPSPSAAPIPALERLRADTDEAERQRQRAKPVFAEPVSRKGRDPDDHDCPVKTFEEPGYSVSKLVRLIETGEIDGFQVEGSNRWRAWTKSVNAYKHTFKEKRLLRHLTRRRDRVGLRDLMDWERERLWWLEDKYADEDT